MLRNLGLEGALPLGIGKWRQHFGKKAAPTGQRGGSNIVGKLPTKTGGSPGDRDFGIDLGERLLAVQGQNQVLRGHHGLTLHAFIGARTDVRRDDDIGKMKQGMVWRRRLLIQDIRSVTADVT